MKFKVIIPNSIYKPSPDAGRNYKFNKPVEFIGIDMDTETTHFIVHADVASHVWSWIRDNVDIMTSDIVVTEYFSNEEVGEQIKLGKVNIYEISYIENGITKYQLIVDDGGMTLVAKFLKSLNGKKYNIRILSSDLKRKNLVFDDNGFLDIRCLTYEVVSIRSQKLKPYVFWIGHVDGEMPTHEDMYKVITGWFGIRSIFDADPHFKLRNIHKHYKVRNDIDNYHIDRISGSAILVAPKIHIKEI
jgi:hypothetical protein